MINPRLGELKRRLDELLSRCEASTLALQKNPDGEERARLAAELRSITAEMNVVNAERCELAEELDLVRKEPGDTTGE